MSIIELAKWICDYLGIEFVEIGSMTFDPLTECYAVDEYEFQEIVYVIVNDNGKKVNMFYSSSRMKLWLKLGDEIARLDTLGGKK